MFEHLWQVISDFWNAPINIFTLPGLVAMGGLIIALIASFTPFPEWSKRKIKKYTAKLLLYYHRKRIERRGLIGKWLKCPNCLKIAKLEIRDNKVYTIIYTVLGPGPWNKCECFSEPWCKWDFNRFHILSDNVNPPVAYVEVVRKLASTYIQTPSDLTLRRDIYSSSLPPESGGEIRFWLPEGHRYRPWKYEISTNAPGKLKYSIGVDDKLIVPWRYVFEHREEHPFI